MKVLGIAGPPGERRTLRERVVDRLSREGSVATVAPAGDGSGADAGDGVRSSWRIGAGGNWSAEGVDATVDDVLDRLAPDHDVAVVEGFPDADVPRVAVGDATEEDALASGRTADAVDVDAVAAAIESVEPHETLESLVARAKRSPDAERSGAIATFTGRVRAKDSEDDTPTEFLEFEKYEGVADDRMATIAAELEERDGVFEVVMHHRTGVLEYGQDIVFVVVLAGHREEAFRTVEDGIDRLKDEVPIFKREVTVDEEFWVHERE